MRILLIDDDLELREILRVNLESEGFIVDTASDGESGSYTARTNQYNLIILDNILPKKSGLIVAREIRASHGNAPILLISVCTDSAEKVKLLESGVDDYLTKPFAFAELVARVKALVRRPYNITEPVMTLDDLTIDSTRHEVIRDNKRLYLTRKEFMLLECLMQSSGKVVSRGQLMDHVWNQEADPFSNTIEAHIRNLRKKVDTKKRKLIHTISGHGYKIDRQK